MTTESTAAAAAVEDIPTLESADELFAIDDMTIQSVYVAPWKRNVNIRTLTSEDAVKLGEMNQGESRKNADIFMVMLCVCDKTGKPILKAADLEKFKKKSVLAFQDLQNAVLKLNRVGKYAKND